MLLIHHISFTIQPDFSLLGPARFRLGVQNYQQKGLPSWHDADRRTTRSFRELVAQHQGTLYSDVSFTRQANICMQTSLHTKGVESVRSPVANLVSFSPHVTHETFVNAVARAFREKYDSKRNNGEIAYVEHGSEIVERGAEELRVSVVLTF